MLMTVGQPAAAAFALMAVDPSVALEIADSMTVTGPQ